MISKHLTIAAAFVLIASLGVGTALAQATAPRNGARDNHGCSGYRACRQTPVRPSSKPPRHPPRRPRNPYGLMDIIHKRNPVSMGVLGNSARHVDRHLVLLLHQVLRARPAS